LADVLKLFFKFYLDEFSPIEHFLGKRYEKQDSEEQTTFLISDIEILIIESNELTYFLILLNLVYVFIYSINDITSSITEPDLLGECLGHSGSVRVSLEYTIRLTRI
jgi:hypothetical protein